MAEVGTQDASLDEAANNEFSNIIKSRSDEHDAVQRKTFTKWINARFTKVGKPPIKDMFADLRDGRKLLDLLEGLTGSVLTKERGSTRVHALNNVNKVLQVLHQNNVELVNIGGTDIVDGNHKLTLGLIWSIILHWQVKDIMKDIMSHLHQTNSEKILLSWVRQSTRPYNQINVLNFTTSWTDGLAFNAIIHKFKPGLFSWEKILKMSPVERLEHAFNLAKQHLAIERLLDPEDVAVPLPDKKSIIIYVTSFFEVLPKEVTMDDIREVETLPRRYNVDSVESQFNSQQSTASEEEMSRSYMETPSTVMEMEMEVDLDSYQATLEEVLTWLLSAEDTFQMQDDISNDVEDVKDQFHTHEVLQNDLEMEQVKVNSLTHMVVVVDENSGEGATAALEEQLQRLFKAWLTEKEEALSKVQTRHFKDPSDINVNVRRLATLKEDMEMKRRTLDQLSDAGQDVAQLLNSKKVQDKIDSDMEELTQRWDNLVQKLEDCSNQVTDSVAESGMSQVQEKAVIETVTMTEKMNTKQSKQKLPPPPPPKKRQMHVDMEVKKLNESEFAEILNWILRTQASIQALEFKDYKKIRATSGIKEKIKSVDAELTDKQEKMEEVTRSGQKLLEQMEKEGLPADEVQSTLEKISSEWKNSGRQLEELKKKVQYQDEINAFSKELQELEQVVKGKEAWLKEVPTQASEVQPVHTLKASCEAELTQLTGLNPRVEKLASVAAALCREPSSPSFVQADLNTLNARFRAVLQELQIKQQQLHTVLNVTITEWMLHEELEQQQPMIEKLAAVAKRLQDQDQGNITKGCLVGFEDVQARWNTLTSRAKDEVCKLQDVTANLGEFEDKSGEVQKWMDGVESFLTKENVALEDAEKLRENLEQCTMFVNEMESMEVALKSMKDCEAALKLQSFLGLRGWGQSRLANYQARWEKLAKQILSHHDRISENQEKAENLRKDLTEMQEWMSQADEEYLMRDFEYKTPEELEGALEEMKRAKEDVLQKEVKVKIMKDSINMLVAKSPPGGQDLTLKLAVVLKNYQKLCDRFRSKCHTLEEVWSCWIELMQYLDMETNWLINLEEQVQSAENLLDSTEAVNEALESLESVLRHPADNRTQIRELGQTLIDGGILDEIISEKLEAFNTRYEELSHQAVRRQISLEQHLQCLRENDQLLQALQESLTQLDQQLTSYLTDRLDAFQLPQEAQTIQAEIAAYEVSLEELRRRNAGNFPPVTPEGRSPRGGTLLDVLQTIQAEIAAYEVSLEELRRRNAGNFPPVTPEGKSPRGGTLLDVLQRKHREISTKYQLFQKPANFEQRMLDCKRVLDGAKAELQVLDVRSVEPDEIKAHFDGCMKLYKTLSEVKLEVETVIKTGRQIVQKQQTDNPKGMDEQLTALKLLYNDLGAQKNLDTICCSRCFDKSVEEWRQFHCDLNDLTQWVTEAEQLLADGSGPDGVLDLDQAKMQQQELEEGLTSHQSIYTTLNKTGEGIIGQLSVPDSSLLQEKLSRLNKRWKAISREVRERQNKCFDKSVEEWRQFHCDLNDLTQWVTEAEQLLADGSGPDGVLDLDQAKMQQQELEEGLTSHQSIYTTLNKTGEGIIGQLSVPDSSLLQEKLSRLNKRWKAISREELAEKMDSENEKLNWLNKNGPQILSSRGMSLQEREKHVTRLRAVNMNWSKVSRELFDKVGEVEVNLQSQFQDKINQLSDWVSMKRQKLSTKGPSRMSASELQMLETTMKERKTEMEDLLARSIDLQKRQQLLPQEKSKIEQLAADWKALDFILKEVVQQPTVSCTQQVTQQRVTVPSVVQMASLVTSDATHQTVQSPDPVAPTDLNETATELADWLVLIDQMLKSNIVTVGDVDEIRATVERLKRTKADLEQRHPQLEDIFTLAQNIKNKTSNVDVRTFITEKLEQVRNQWDSTQHGVETRLQQLEDMVTDSNQWEEQRREVEMLIGQNEVRQHNLQQLSKEPLTKQLADYKMFLQDLNKGQIAVAAFNDLSGKLLCDYPNDDTRRVKEATDGNNMAWNTINNRARDRQSSLDSDIKMLQTSLKEMEGFLKWLQEAETTGNVLADASQRESLSQDSVCVKELRNQLEGHYSRYFLIPKRQGTTIHRLAGEFSIGARPTARSFHQFLGHMAAAVSLTVAILGTDTLEPVHKPGIANIISTCTATQHVASTLYPVCTRDS
ncbi:UNVERIFIED_CONTAM: hypothetical protein FKN15_028054 [Acipenser sinensis]